MTREEFIKRCALMGVGITLAPTLLAGCRKEDELNVQFTGKTIVIGAGAAGLMAGYTLQRHGANFEILEASSIYGGRVKKLENFADFPIDLGAEWIHSKPRVFSRLIDDESKPGSVDLIPYKLNTYYQWNKGKLQRRNWAATFYGEYKFKRSTWYDFFENYIVPSFAKKITYNTPITRIDYSSSLVEVVDQNGITHTADRVILTVPLAILQKGFIGFTPPLPEEKVNAMNEVSIPPGLKVFMKFSKKFYPDLVSVGDMIFGDGGERLYYDAAFKKDSPEHVLALFNVGDSASDFTELNSAQEVLDAVLAELDQIFDGQASQYYLSGVVQNWSAEPYIQGSYSFAGSRHRQRIEKMNSSISDRLYFAGEAMHPDEWSTVHGAGFSGVTAAQDVLKTA
ncbi:FAD-dependent oxidoreductase [bacterium SCSIO 12741]|nr:FAD-dependent oxidoreductase [bacterium SCSIO 12741]